MIGVYLLHSEFYYGIGDIQYGMIFAPFYVNAFFFVSGYLLFGKYMNITAFNRGVYLKSLENVVFRLMIPSILFSAITFVPKMMFHGEEIDISTFCMNVFGGISYWFTSALLVAQVVLLTLMMLLRRTNIWWYLLCSSLFFFLGWNLNEIRTDSSAEAFFPWFWETGLEYTLLMVFGGLYMKYENQANAASRYLVIGSFVVYIAAMYMSMSGMELTMMGLGGRCDLKGGILILAGVTLIVTVCHFIKENQFFAYLGRNSIVFYFLSGVFPAFVGTIAQRFFPERIYAMTIIVTILSLVLAWMASFVINKYFPFFIDLRKLKHTKNEK